MADMVPQLLYYNLKLQQLNEAFELALDVLYAIHFYIILTTTDVSSFQKLQVAVQEWCNLEWKIMIEKGHDKDTDRETKNYMEKDNTRRIEKTKQEDI